MTRSEFMSQLESRLSKRLDVHEVQEALAFYREYFDEAGPENEQAVIAELGDPARIASQILSERAMRVADEEPQSVKKGLSAVWIVILSIFAAPVALPLAIALVMVMVGLLTGIVGIIFAFLVCLIAAVLVGVAFIALGIVLLFQSFSTGLLYLGIGMVSSGAALVFVPAIMWLANRAFRALATFFNFIVEKFRARFGNKQAEGVA